MKIVAYILLLMLSSTSFAIDLKSVSPCNSNPLTQIWTDAHEGCVLTLTQLSSHQCILTYDENASPVTYRIIYHQTVCDCTIPEDAILLAGYDSEGPTCKTSPL